MKSKIFNKFKLFKHLQSLIFIRKEIKKINEETIINDNQDIVLSINNLTKFFINSQGEYKKVLDKINFKLKKGQFHGFIGDNGAGKTTTFRSILGFYNSYGGKITINGIDSKNKESKKFIGYIPEVAIFPKNINSWDFLTSMGQISNKKLPKKDMKSRITNICNKLEFDLKELDKSPYYMSSGQKKKIMLIQALIHDPELLILDEPAANLDPSARNEFFSILQQLNKEGKTILISSHIISELQLHIDSYTFIKGGKIVETTSIEEKINTLSYDRKINTNNNSLIIDFLTLNNVPFHLKDNFIFYKLNEYQEKVFNDFLLENKIHIYELQKININLNEIIFNQK